MDWSDSLPREIAEQNSFGTIGYNKKATFLLAKSALLLRDVPLRLGFDKLDIAYPLIGAISNNALATAKLADSSLFNEVHIILRNLIERVITFYYLQCCGSEELLNYKEYTSQKTYRKIQSNLSYFQIAYPETVCKRKIEGFVESKLKPELKRIINKFTGKINKNPITRWSKLSIEKKINVIDEYKITNTKLLTMYMDIIYDDASEALHGTLYGCTFHMGFYDPGAKLKEEEDIASYTQENLSLLLLTYWKRC